MSARVVEGVDFSLRSVVGGAAQPSPLSTLSKHSLRAAAQPAAAPAGPAKGGGLRFDIAGFKERAASADAPRPVEARPAVPAALRGLAEAQSNAARADAIRLTATVDGLNVRLKRATERAAAVEAQLKLTHGALVAERQAAATKALAASADGKSARETEARLRQELGALAKKEEVAARERAAHSQSFEKSAAAAAAANAEAQAFRKKTDTLTAQLSESAARVAAAEKEVSKLRKSSSLAQKEVEGLKSEHSRAMGTLEGARAELAAALEANAALERKLAATVASEATAKEAVGACRCGVEQVLEYPEPEPAPGAEAGPEAAPETTSETTPETTPETAPEPAPETAPETAPEPAPEAAAGAGPPSAVKIVSSLDAVQMHAEYNDLRLKTLNLAKRVEELRESGADAAAVDRAAARRDILYRQAASLKSRYEVLFGTAEDDRQEAAAATAAVPAESSLVFLGSEPKETCRRPATSFASRMAASNALGGAVSLSAVDCGIDFSAATVPPIDAGGGEVPEAEAGAGPEAEIEATDSQEDMVGAIVEDLTKFLKNSCEVQMRTRKVLDV